MTHLDLTIEARHGKVVVVLTDEKMPIIRITKALSRKEAMEAMLQLASAIQHAGDICDPQSVFLVDSIKEMKDRGQW